MTLHDGRRILHVPGGHNYTQRIRPTPALRRHTYAVDPPVPGAPPGRWWPPPALAGSWVDAHHGEIDLVHLHFGFDPFTPDQLRDWVRALERHALPLVLTLHDVVNPHFREQGQHLARLDVLVPAATSVITLTPSAADAIRARWRREAVVIAHPHVAPLELVGRPRPRSAHPFTVGMHLKSLRANVRAGPVVGAVADAVAALPDARLVVHLLREVTDTSHPRHDPDLLDRLRDLEERALLTMTVHDPHSDAQLWNYLRGIDLSVLPYAFGTHSGWIEACFDLGTAVLAPRTGSWVEQQPCYTFGWDPGQDPDAHEITAAIATAYAQRPPLQATRAGREAQQQEIADAHERLYDLALGDRREVEG